MAVDDDPTTRWATDAGTKSAWLEIDLGEPRKIGRAVIQEAYGRVRQYELQAEVDGRWQAFHRGTTLGDRAALEFKPVTAQRIRLNLLDASDGPTIWEFQVFKP